MEESIWSLKRGIILIQNQMLIWVESTLLHGKHWT